MLQSPCVTGSLRCSHFSNPCKFGIKKCVFATWVLPSDPDNKGQFGLSWNIKVSHPAGDAAQADLTPVHLPVLLVVLLSPLEDQFPLHFTGLEIETF